MNPDLSGAVEEELEEGYADAPSSGLRERYPIYQDKPLDTVGHTVEKLTQRASAYM